MALPDMLSAVRELILDEGLPPQPESRRSDLARRFPNLSQQEIDDLAAIPLSRLSVYTNLVFAGERSMLEWAFPMSFAAIARIAGVERDERASRALMFETVRDLHRRRPWQSSSTRALAENFEAFVKQSRPNWTSTWPGLSELIAFERIDLEVFYAEDVPHRPMTDAAWSELTAKSVEALLETPVLRPPYAAVAHWNYDVLDLDAAWHDAAALPDPLPGLKACRAACGRAPDSLMPRWSRQAPEACAALSDLAPGRTSSINDLAESYLANLSDARRAEPEAQRFSAFFNALRDWFSAGVVLLVDE